MYSTWPDLIALKTCIKRVGSSPMCVQTWYLSSFVKVDKIIVFFVKLQFYLNLLYNPDNNIVYDGQVFLVEPISPQMFFIFPIKCFFHDT